MIKVIIADDEEKVCQLILRLVDWAELDMEVVGVAHNGIEVLQMIEEYNPYIVITDIRMPGYDGLEMIRRAKEINATAKFIIISGYRHFEYAQNAIRYGVKEYLLKPVDEKELLNILKKLRTEYMQKTQQLTYEESVLLTLKNDKGKLRSAFLSGILYPVNKGEQIYDIKQINEHYHYKFQSGCFQIVSIKIDEIAGDYAGSMEFLTEKIKNAVKENLEEYCYDYELYFENSRSYCMLNYGEDSRNLIRKQLKLLLDDLLVQESIFENIKVTIGAGVLKNSLEEILASKKSAVFAVEQRLVDGTNRLIDGESIVPCDIGNLPVFSTFNRKMSLALEHLNQEEVKLLLMKVRGELIHTQQITGHEILQMAREIGNLYQLFLKNNGLERENQQHFFEHFIQKTDDFYTVSSLYTYLTKEIMDSLQDVIENKKQADNRPIRVAKLFINEHYMHHVGGCGIGCGI